MRIREAAIVESVQEVVLSVSCDRSVRAWQMELPAAPVSGGWALWPPCRPYGSPLERLLWGGSGRLEGGICGAYPEL